MGIREIIGKAITDIRCKGESLNGWLAISEWVIELEGEF
jgi:hypothetical protein